MKIKNLIIHIFILCTFIQLSAQSNRYVENSVLSKGDWYKIQVEQTGIHKITYEQLINMGVKNPANVSVFGYGGAQLSESFLEPYIDDLPQLSIYVEKGSDGVFGKGDYILFYAQGPIKWTYNKNTNRFEHEVNTYSNYGYYFITSDVSELKHIGETNRLTATHSTPITTFNDYYLYEKEEINLLNSGRVFLCDVFSQTQLTRTYNIEIPNLLNETSILQANIANTSVSSAKMKIEIDNTTLGEIELPARPSNDVAAAAINTKNDFIPTNKNKISLKFTFMNSSSLAYLDYFLLNVKRKLQKTIGSSLVFRTTDNIGQPGNYIYNITNTNPNVQIWNITNPQNIFQIPKDVVGNSISFVDDKLTLKEYIAIDVKSDNFPQPIFINKITNQNLHSLGQVDMIIVSPTEFVDAAKRLASAHLTYDGITSHVVTPEIIYNEFSSGTPDATAYRRFAKMFYDRAKSVGNPPKYMLLLGDGSFDNRQILKANTDKNIYRLLTYQSKESFDDLKSYTTDDYFGFLDDEDGVYLLTNTLDIAVGRIPAYTEEQASAVVDKLIRYLKNDDLGYWKNRALFIADDGDDNLHVIEADSVANVFQKYNPSVLTRKLYLDSYIQEVSAVGETYPTLKKEFLDYINDGVLFVNYMGHSGYNNWTNEQILTIADIDAMYNQRLPLYITASCSFSRFDDFNVSGGEVLITNKLGGAMALISTARTVLAHPNMLLNLELVKELLTYNTETQRINTIGEAYRIAKNKRSKSNDSNRLPFVLLGDPAISLAIPSTHTISIDEINGKIIKNKIDTIGALEHVTLEGSVVFSKDSILDDTFNGSVHIMIFDKNETIETLCNDKKIDETTLPYVYTYRNNPLFVGTVAVTNGKFNVEFIVPKDIKYNYGTGRIVMYAHDENQGLEANGHFEKILIGGEGENILYETTGPKIKAYLNTPYFKDGDKVDENPLFVAELNDISGINTIGSGIGHDIILRLDNNLKQEFILNNYYETLYGSYDKGIIRFPLNNLPVGKHSLFFRVWDLQNNSSSVNLNFEVVSSLGIDLKELFVYPNPVQDIANLVIKHDRPLELVDLDIFVYDLSGQIICSDSKKLVSDVSCTINLNLPIPHSIHNGLYFVKVIISNDNEKKSSKTTKIFVHKQ